MVFANFCVLVITVERLAINALVVRRLSGTLLQSVASCTEGACFCSSAFPKSVIESGAFEASVCHKIVFYVAD